MNGNTIGLVSALFGLFCFGVLYNQGVAMAKRSGWMEPYTALFVAIGCLVTIGGIAMIDTLVAWNAGLVALVAFAASGAPMIFGDAARYVSAVKHDIESHRNDES